jgi:hypothetical protein
MAVKWLEQILYIRLICPRPDVFSESARGAETKVHWSLPSCSFCCSSLGPLEVSVSFELHAHCIRVPVLGRLEVLKSPTIQFSILPDAVCYRGGGASTGDLLSQHILMSVD